MSINLQNCLKELDLIAKIKKPSVTKQVLSDVCDNECIYKALKEIAVNIVNRKVKLSYQQKKDLKRFGIIIKKLSSDQSSKLNRRKLVVQSGGALPILIPAVIALLTNLIQNGKL